MNKHKFYDGDVAHNRVSKTAARKLWEGGRPIVFCPVKLAPFGSFRPSCMLQKGEERPDFDAAVRDFVWYNCQMRETGYYPAFYVADIPVSIKPFIFENWHAWTSTGGVMLSDESEKKLREFKSPDECINWLFMNGDKPAARALDKHVKGN